MHLIRVLIISITIASCGGGGGGGSTPAVPFLITLGLTSFSLNEDSTFSGSIAASANEPVSFTYSIDSQPENGSVTLASTNAEISKPVIPVSVTES